MTPRLPVGADEAKVESVRVALMRDSVGKVGGAPGEGRLIIVGGPTRCHHHELLEFLVVCYLKYRKSECRDKLG